MNDPHIWWYVTRSSAMLAWILLTLSVVWGVLLSTRILRRVDDAGRLQDLHRFLAWLALLMTALHVVSLMLDGWLHFTPLEALVPFQTHYRPVAVALGILALYVMLAVYLSSIARARLPHRLWKALHMGNYAAVILVSFHAGLSGTDAGRWWYLALATALLSTTAITTVVRVVLSQRDPLPTPPAGSVAPASKPALVAQAPETISLVVAAVTTFADDVRGVRFVALGGGELPHWDAGAHLTLELPGIGTREFSLCGDPAEHGHYDIAVRRDPLSRGGSEWIHRALQPGTTVAAWHPRNHFRLIAARRYLFIAGGIGITPIKAMIESLPPQREWALLYLGRTRRAMPFAAELAARYPGRVGVYARDEHFGRADIAAVVGASNAEIYCCGPASLIDDVASVAAGRRVHSERFVPIEHLDARPRALTVSCTRSAIEVTVPEQMSVLDALEARGVPIVASCRRGVCGSCETRVLAGVPEHLDSVLENSEKDEFGIMFPCVSRAVGDRLVLDV